MKKSLFACPLTQNIMNPIVKRIAAAMALLLLSVSCFREDFEVDGVVWWIYGSGGEVDAPLTYADYYFLEALFRLRYLK